MITKPLIPVLPVPKRQELAIEALVDGLKTVAAAAEHSSDPRLFREIALKTLKEASRWIEIPMENRR